MLELKLTPDELLTTTRTVRKRLDFDKPVSRRTVEECLTIAFQAPNGGNMNTWRWIAIDDRATISELARLYNQGLDDYIATFGEAGYPGADVPGADGSERRRSICATTSTARPWCCSR